MAIATDSKGWSAPYDKEQAVVALKATGMYQCAANIFMIDVETPAIKVPLNWRNVDTLRQHYWVTPRVFSHLIHVVVASPDDCKETWPAHSVKLLSQPEVLYAYFAGCQEAIKQNQDLTPWTNAARTAQVQFHVLTHSMDILKQNVQLSENLMADDRALGHSALQKAFKIREAMHLLLSKGIELGLRPCHRCVRPYAGAWLWHVCPW